MELQENQCPRCLGMIPNNLRPGEYPGALSRFDNATEICSRCGEDEAMGLGPVPDGLWPVRRDSTPDSVLTDHKVITIELIR